MQPKIRKERGTLGYAIDSGCRGMGYGTFFLGLLIDQAKKICESDLYFTIKKPNWASRIVLERNGGVFYDETDLRWQFYIKK